MSDLRSRSIEIILEGQAASGAYIASPNFPTYSYSWFRDGAFIAHAMDLVGQPESARRFHEWAASAILRRSDLVERAVARAGLDLNLGPNEVLHTRYGLNGEPAGGGEWPNFQLDGFGTWLWSLGDHLHRTGSKLNGPLQEASHLTAAYLSALWRLPCYDCWEEFPDRIHPYTLASICAGLEAHQKMGSADHQEHLVPLKRMLMGTSLAGGGFVKSLGSREVDSSLLGVATPYRVVEPDDPRLQKTVARIEHELINGGGLHRYAADTYYGGGEWVLLTAWLAWHHRRLGHDDRARTLLHWVEQQADGEGMLPEQVPASLNNPAFYPVWIKRWGPVARPLLWSHAMYLIASE